MGLLSQEIIDHIFGFSDFITAFNVGLCSSFILLQLLRPSPTLYKELYETNNIEAVKFIVENGKQDLLSSEALLWSCMGRHYEMVCYVCSEPKLNFKKYELSLEICCSGGHFNIIRYLIECQGFKVSSHCIDLVIQYHYLDILMYFLWDYMDLNPLSSYWISAIRYRNKEALDVLFTKFPEFKSLDLVSTAVETKWFDILDYLINQWGQKVDPRNFITLVKFDRIDCIRWIRWLYQYCVDLPSDMDTVAGLFGCLDVLEFLHSVEFRIHSDTMDEACANGHVESMKFLYDTYRFYPKFCDPIHKSISRGFIEPLKFLCNKKGHSDPPLCPKALSYAVFLNRLDIVKFICENIKLNFYSACMMDAAACAGSIEIVKYFHSINRDCSDVAMSQAAVKGDLECVRYLYSIGKSCLPYAIDNACMLGHREVVKFLVSRDMPFTIKAMEQSLRMGMGDILEMLKEKKPYIWEFVRPLSTTH